MDFKLAISLLTIGVLSFTSFVYYIVKELIKSKWRNEKLKIAILTNIGINNNALDTQKETCFVISKKANNIGFDYCDIEFSSDLYALNERMYNHEFVSTFAKESVV